MNPFNKETQSKLICTEIPKSNKNVEYQKVNKVTAKDSAWVYPNRGKTKEVYKENAKMVRDSYINTLSPEEILTKVREGKKPVSRKFKLIYLGGFRNDFTINKKLWCKCLGVNTSDIVFSRKCDNGIREFFINEKIGDILIKGCINNFEGIYWVSDKNEVGESAFGKRERTIIEAINKVILNWEKLPPVCRAANNLKEMIEKGGMRISKMPSYMEIILLKKKLRMIKSR
jgi:hypothetical protein